MAVPLNPLFTVAELGRHLPGAHVARHRHHRRAAPAVARVGRSRRWPAGALGRRRRATSTPGPPAAGAADLAARTGRHCTRSRRGPPGPPKGSSVPGPSWRAEADHFYDTVGVSEDDVILGLVALFHAHGLGNCLLAAVRSGAALVLLAGSAATRPWPRIERERVTVFPTVPFLARPWPKPVGPTAPTRVAAAVLHRRRPAGPGDLRPVGRPASARPLRQLYGCSEAGSVTINLDDGRRRDRGFGRPADEGHRPGRRRRRRPSRWPRRERRDHLRQPGRHHRLRGLSPGGQRRASPAAGSAPATSVTSTTPATCTSPAGPSCSSPPAATRSTRSRSRTCSGATPRRRRGGGRRRRCRWARRWSRPWSSTRGCPTTASSATSCWPCAGRSSRSTRFPRIVAFRAEIPRSPLGKILRKYLV